MTEPLSASIYYKLDYEVPEIDQTRFKLDFQAIPVLAENTVNHKIDYQSAAQMNYYKIDYDRVHTIRTKLDYEIPASAHYSLDYAAVPMATIFHSLDYQRKRVNRYAPHARVISFRWG